MKIEKLYNKVLIKSRNYDLYYKCNIIENLQNKIILFLIHFAFVFNKIKDLNSINNQRLFDYIFPKIEIDLRELGYGDMSINKKMKIIVNKFYSILLDFRDFQHKSFKNKIKLFKNLINSNNDNKIDYFNLINYFDKFAKNIDLLTINDIYSAKF